jgi:uncharacterized phage protein (TIGR01671 family)
MSREIKFRAWDKETGLWYGNYGEPFTLKDAMGKMWHTGLDRLEFMQYTGLKDKKGKEIYEGDIVRIGSLDGEPLGEIEWISDQAQYEIRDNDKYQFGGEHVNELHTRYFEVIGNIHENPELLGDTKA